MKTAIICIAKNEDKYIKEWVNYHLNLGFDNIIICDNDDEDIISKIIDDNRVIILDYRNNRQKHSFQSFAYTEVFNRYKNDYDWITFIDCDEFIVLDEKYKNISDFLYDDIFKNVDIIRLHWRCFSGGDELDVIDDDYSVFERFKTLFDTDKNKWGKSFLRTSSIPDNCKIRGGHGYFEDKTLKVCNAIGGNCENNWSVVNEVPLYENAWINHYPTKTIGEYIRQKYFRGGPNNNNIKYGTLKYFFDFNEYTYEKIKYGKKIMNILFKKYHKIPGQIKIGYEFNFKKKETG